MGLKESLTLGYESLLVCNMLYNIVAHYQVKLMLQFLELEHIGCNEGGLDGLLLKECYGRLNFANGYIHTRHIASHACKRQQITALAATYLKDFQIVIYLEEPFNVGQEILLAGYGQFIKILFVVTMSGLHLDSTLLYEFAKVVIFANFAPESISKDIPMTVRKQVHTYTVKSFECDRKDTLRLLTLLNLLQDIADDSANEIGIGYDYLRTVGKAWVLIAMNVQIDRMPHLQEEITIKSWPSDFNALYSEREFEVWSADGQRIIRACSQWIVIDYESRRPVHLKEWLPLYEPIREKVILEDRFPKLPAVEQEDYSERFLVRYDDIDRNDHVNNAIYSLWASESLVPEYRLEHVPASLMVNFRKEGRFGEKILVSTQMDGECSLHSIQAVDDGRELARVRFTWRK